LLHVTAFDCVVSDAIVLFAELDWQPSSNELSATMALERKMCLAIVASACSPAPTL